MKRLARATTDSVPAVTKTPVIMMPMLMRLRAFQYSMPKRKATKAPPQAELPGKGATTNKKRKSGPNFAKFLPWSLRVFSKSLWKNFSIFFDFLRRKFVTGEMSHNVKAPGKMVPATAKVKVETIDSPSVAPSGMASFRSKNGIIAVKKTVNSFSMPSFNYIFLQIGNLDFLV